MSGGSSSWKGFGSGRGKGGRKASDIVEGSLGPDEFGEAVEEFPDECKSDFNKNNPLRSYENRREEWPTCRHGEDCLVQMMADGTDGGRRFFKCPRAWSSKAPENCRFTRWIDPAPLHPHQDYIYYLQNRLFDLEMNMSSGNKDDSTNGDGSEEALCMDPDCTCACHKKDGPPPPQPPPPPPPTMGGYYGEGATQFAMWGHY